MRAVELVSGALLLYCTWCAVLYLGLYLRRPWWASRVGRAMMTKALANVVLLGMATAYLLAGDYPGRDLVRLGGFGLLAVGLTYLLVALVRTPRSRYERARHPRPAPPPMPSSDADA